MYLKNYDKENKEKTFRRMARSLAEIAKNTRKPKDAEGKKEICVSNVHTKAKRN